MNYSLLVLLVLIWHLDRQAGPTEEGLQRATKKGYKKELKKNRKIKKQSLDQ